MPLKVLSKVWDPMLSEMFFFNKCITKDIITLKRYCQYMVS